MVTRILVCLALVVLLAGQAASPVQAVLQRPGAVDDGYSAYVACSYQTTAKPSHACRETQSKAAFFLSRRHDATYKVCVKYPGKPQRLCASEQDAPKGEKQFVTIATASVGKHKATWYVAGRKVASWSFRVTTA